MGENIEVKDVQKTEYLDKNGLDMLWAKVKENTHNQVEIERNRAVAKENSIVDTKADKSEFSNYVPSATFTALEKKVSDNTAAISNKQNAGNYLHYETLNDEGYYEIPNVCISESDAKLKAILTPYAFQIVAGDLEGDGETGVVITSNDRNPYIALTDDAYRNTLKITREGISNTDNNANHVYATDGSLADLTQYALSSTLAALEQKVTANTTAISAKQDAGNYIPFDESDESNYKINRPLKYEGYLGKFSFLGDKIFSISNTNKNFSLTDSSISYHIGRIGISLSTQGFNVTEDGNFDINIDSTSIQLGKTANPNVKINANGISLPNGDNNHVLTSHGSTIDITQYAKKSEITAGGNVDDVQVNGVTVVENKIANIKPATKENLGVVKVGDGLNVTDGTISVDTTAIGAGNYVSYKSIHNGESYEMSKGLFYQYNNGFNSGDLRLGPTQIQINSNDSTTNIAGNYASLAKGNNEMIIRPDGIDFRFEGSQYFVLNENGLKLKDGDNNHVLTSNASTIDITQYVLKSVYDEKIAALEARIAALEAAA